MKIATVRIDGRGRLTIPMSFLNANKINLNSMVDIELIHPLSEGKKVVLSFSDKDESKELSYSDEWDKVKDAGKDLEIGSVDL